jgi:hypothetical protein
MAALSRIHTQAILDAYSFRDARYIVDVGGAHGVFLAAALQQAPQARGILFDQAQVVAGAAAVLEGFGVAERVQCVAGDFLRDMPQGGDVYLLKHILHDWNDQDCVSILRKVRESMVPDGRVIVAELPVADDGRDAALAAMFDLNMLVMLGGRERAPAEYAALFERVGLHLHRVVPTAAAIAVIEARRE